MIEQLMSGFTFVEPSIASGLVFRTTQEANWFRSIHEPTDAEAILDTWPRISDRTWYSDASETSGATSDWYYDEERDSFVQPNNVGGSEFIVSPIKISSYVLDVTLTSENGDDDYIGMVAAADVFDGDKVRFLAFWINAGQEHSGTVERLTARYGDETNGNYSHFGGLGDFLEGNSIIASHENPEGDGWSGKTVRMRIARSGPIVSCTISDWDSDELLPETEIIINLSELPRDGATLAGASRYGFATNSQADSTYLNYSIRSSDIEDDTAIYSEDENKRWVFTGGSWDETGTAYEDFSEVDRVVNRITGEVFDVNTSTLQFRRNNGIPYGSPTVNESDGEVLVSDILEEFEFEEELDVVGVFSGGSLESDKVAVDGSGSFNVLLSTEEKTDEETGIISRTIAFRKINYS